MYITGRFFDGDSGKPHKAEIHVSEVGLKITAKDSGIDEYWNWPEITVIDHPVPPQPGKLGVIHDPDRVLIVEVGEWPVIEKHLRDQRRRFPVPAGWLHLGFYAALAALVVAGFIFYAPKLAESSVAFIPDEVDAKIGDMVIEGFAENPVCTAPEGRAALDKLTTHLFAAAAGNYTIHALRDDETINAFALPGTHIVVMSGILDFMEDQDELAGVLAHEAGHIEMRHSMKKLVHNLGLGIAFSMMTGDVSGVGNILRATRMLGDIQYTRENEVDADEYGATILKRSKMNPTGLMRMFERLREKYGIDEDSRIVSLLSDHPPTDQRVEILSRAEIEGGSYTKPLSDTEWQALKNICDEVATTGNTTAQPEADTETGPE